MKVQIPECATMSGRREVVLAGAGGQGLVFLGRLLGNAAARAGLRVTQTQSYGVASRGGFSKSELVFSPKPIAYPMAVNPWGVLALTDEARKMYRRGTDGGDGLVVFDSSAASEPEGSGERGLPFLKIAREKGMADSFNMIALGAFIALRPAVDPQYVIEILDESDNEMASINREAFLLGLELPQETSG
ncbi:MAG: 2-oxoacid:acceptor oxidoreductase family protein [Clostridia bacterium]